MTDEEFEKNMRRAFPFYDIKSGIDFKAEAPEFMKGQTPYKTATELYHGELMTKIDTKEIRKRFDYNGDGRLSASLTTYAPLLTNAYDQILILCNAYDEAQKEIEELKEITTLHCEKRGDMLIEQDKRVEILETENAALKEVARIHCEKRIEVNNACLQAQARISTLEALLREVLKEGVNYEEALETYKCSLCGGILKLHSEKCLFTRIQKELEE